MKLWRIVVSGLFGLALAGCRNDPSVALLERDNFKKEQEINRLRYENQELKEALSTEVPARPRTTDGGRSAKAATSPASSFTQPDQDQSLPDIGAMGTPDFSHSTTVPKGVVPERMKPPSDGGPPRQTLPASTPSSGGSSSDKGAQWHPTGNQPPAATSLPADNSSVCQITLHPALTGGIGSSTRPSDEGLLVVVEPRDFGGNIVNVPGPISVALLDPALTGEQARLARWDFSAAQTQGMFRMGPQQGILLRLPWTSTPALDRLKVFVRYTTRDGKKLQAERLISVALNDSPPARGEAPPDAEPAQTASRPQRPQWSPVR